MNTYFRSLINTGEFELEKLDERIAAVYAADRLTTEEYGQLRALAMEKANPSASLAPIEDRFDIILQRMDELKSLYEALSARVTALESAPTSDITEPTDEPQPGTEDPSEPGTSEPATEPTEPEEPYDPTANIPEWTQPLGAHDAYKHGDRVKYNGRIYESVMLIANVWSPDAYPSGWTDVTSEYEMMSYGDDTTEENDASSDNTDTSSDNTDTSSDNTDTSDAASGSEPDSGVSDSSGETDTNETDEQGG